MTVRIHPLRSACLLILVLLGPTACRQAPAGRTLLIERTSTSFLESELGRAIEDVASARDALGSNPDQASERLTDVGRNLTRLRDLYLPLFRAKQNADNAARLHAVGRDDEAVSELDEIRDAVMTVSGGAGEALLGELERIEELVTDAQLELEAGSATADATLGNLRIELQDFVNRAGLFLGDGPG